MEEKKYRQLLHRIEDMQRELSELKQELFAHAPSRRPASESYRGHASLPSQTPSQTTLPLSQNPPQGGRTASAQEGRFSAAAFEELLGGNLLGKLGFLTLVITAAWFVKLAVDYRWLNASARIFLGILSGFGFAGLGLSFFKKGYRLLWPVSTGSGFAIVYISVFAAWYFYDFFGFAESFLYLLGLSLLVMAWALFLESEALYAFAVLGAFLLPFLYSSGENSYRFLFSYIAFLHFLYFLAGFRFSFRVVGWILWMLTMPVVLIWASKHLETSSGFVVLSFLLFCYLLFIARLLFLNTAFLQLPVLEKRQVVSFASHKRAENKEFLYFLSQVSDPVLGFVAFLFTAFLGYLVFLERFSAARTLWFVILLALLSATVFPLLKQKLQRSLSFLAFSFWQAALWILAWALVLSGLFYDFEGQWWLAGLLGLAISWQLLSARFGLLGLQILSLGLWLIMLPLFFLAADAPWYAWPFLNQRFFFPSAAAAALALSYLLWPRPEHSGHSRKESLAKKVAAQGQSQSHLMKNLAGKKEHGMEKKKSGWQIFWPSLGLTVAIGAVQVEVYHWISDEGLRHIVYNLIFVVFSAALLLPGFVYSSRPLRYAGLAVVSVLLLKFYFHDIASMRLVYRVLIGLVSGLGLVAFSMFYQRYYKKER